MGRILSKQKFRVKIEWKKLNGKNLMFKNTTVVGKEWPFYIMWCEECEDAMP